MSTSEKSRCTYSVSDTGVSRAPRPEVHSVSARIAPAAPLNITWIGSSLERVLERHGLTDQVLVPQPVALPSGMLPVHRLEDDLIGVVAIEDERRVIAVRARGGRARQRPRAG